MASDRTIAPIVAHTGCVTDNLLTCLSQGGLIRAAGMFGKSGIHAITTRCDLTVRNLAAGMSDEALKIIGCPVPYGVMSCDLGGFREVYEPGCFTESVTRGDIRVLFNHNANYVIGRTSAGNTLFYETPDGLWCESEPPDTLWADDLIVSMDRGDIDGMSAAFYITQSRWAYRGSEKIRIITKGELVEVSVTSFPAYDDSSALTSKDDKSALLTSIPGGKHIQ